MSSLFKWSSNDGVRCGQCKKALNTKASIVEDRFFHSECLTCKECKKELAGTCYEVSGPKMVCEACFTAKYQPKCTGCQKGIDDPKLLELLGKPYHEKCLPPCHRCSKAPAGKQYMFGADKKPACQECYWIGFRDERLKQAQKSSSAPKTPANVKAK